MRYKIVHSRPNRWDVYYEQQVPKKWWNFKKRRWCLIDECGTEEQAISIVKRNQRYDEHNRKIDEALLQHKVTEKIYE